MAKLNARGRRAVVEAVREHTAEQLQTATDRYVARTYPNSTFPDGSDIGTTRQSLTVWERTTRRLMSDGTILEKRDVRFRPNPNCTWEDPRGERHSYGWKVHGKLKVGLTAADFARIYAEPRKNGSPSSWTVTQGAAIGPTKVISQARVMRAIQRDDHTGFCLSCGAEQGGCEPDANDYKCESCGAMAVQGAENVLMGMAV